MLSKRVTRATAWPFFMPEVDTTGGARSRVDDPAGRSTLRLAAAADTTRQPLEPIGHQDATDRCSTPGEEEEDGTFAFEARVCPLALASLSACFDHYDAVIAVLDEAQFRARRIRVSRDDPHGDIRLALSSNPDAAPGLNVANGNAYALLETLGLEPDSVGAVPLAELRQRLTDPRIRRRLDDDHQLTRYVPTLVAMAAVKPIDGELSLAWA